MILILMPGVSPGSGGPGEVKRNSHVSLVSGGKEDSAMQSSENLRPGLNITPHHTRPDQTRPTFSLSCRFDWKISSYFI